MMGCFELAQAQFMKCFDTALVAAHKPFGPSSNNTRLGRLFGKSWIDFMRAATVSWTAHPFPTQLGFHWEAGGPMEEEDLGLAGDEECVLE